MLEFVRQLISIFYTSSHKTGEYWREKHMRERIDRDKIGEMY